MKKQWTYAIWRSWSDEQATEQTPARAAANAPTLPAHEDT